MLIQEMSREECFAALTHQRLARLACIHEGQPYVIPIYFVHDRPTEDEAYLYSFSALGQKIEWMRANPLVCVELDEVTNYEQWMSIVIFGRYEELPAPAGEEPVLRGAVRRQPERAPERQHAWQLLQAYPMWWQPASAARAQDSVPRTFLPIFYRIRIGQITGRRATAEAKSSEPPHGWLRRLMRRFFSVGTNNPLSEGKPLVSTSDAAAPNQ
jgi:nitroimidazol reductase NimA-like FMN-containing flavoprotein (pyridoxamine 5'-phosphate oxidase superfamily)